MRKIILTSGLAAALMFTLVASAAAPAANFGGTWTLDKGKSQNLGRGMQGADSVTWVITQTDKQITIDQKIAGGDMGGAPGGPGGGRGPGGGMGGPRSYNLDGSETSGEAGPAKFTRKATWSSDGKTLELTSKSTFAGQDGTERTNNSSDKLQLSSDGKVLTVNTHRDGGRGGPQDSTLVFNK